MASPLCRRCGAIIAAELRDAGHEYHLLCAPQTDDFAEPDIPPGLASNHHALRLRDDVTEIIQWANRTSDRSMQKELGASEISDCYRRLGYRLAGIRETGNETDPWPAIVGTGIHLWMEQALTRFEAAHRLGRWSAEMTVHPHPRVKGHTDAYDAQTFTVVDWKSKGSEEMREIRKGVITFDDAIQQISLYGLGHRRAGRRVDHVALVFMPRAGWLSGIYVWSAPFDEAIALAALDRRDRVEAGLAYYDVASIPGNWEKFPAAPGKGCSWCPWHNPKLAGASADGCPGK